MSACLLGCVCVNNNISFECKSLKTHLRGAPKEMVGETSGDQGRRGKTGGDRGEERLGRPGEKRGDWRDQERLERPGEKREDRGGEEGRLGETRGNQGRLEATRGDRGRLGETEASCNKAYLRIAVPTLTL